MNGKLLDTNILIYLSQKTLEFSKVASPGDNLYISVITYMEVLGYRFSNEFEQNFELVEEPKSFEIIGDTKIIRNGMATIVILLQVIQ